MLDTAIIGAGLCGLETARGLAEKGLSFTIFEARERVGGRILSEPCEATGMRVDLGPTWFWPATQPVVTALVAELGLADFPQHDTGETLHLRKADARPETVRGDPVHAGARRLEGGIASLVEALVARLPADAIKLGHVLTSVQDRGSHVELHFSAAGNPDAAPLIIEARSVVLALPPRVVEASIRFEPALGDDFAQALRDTPTWMAAQAKAVIGYERAVWREAGHSGNAFVEHEQAVLGEIFDACSADGTKAALGGFAYLPPETRKAFKVGLPMLLRSQMSHVFGPALENAGTLHYQDWAGEPFTCAPRDLEPLAAHPEYGNPLLRRALWDGKLVFGSSESASQGGGYLEGAIDAARRIAATLVQHFASPSAPSDALNEAPMNDRSLAEFKTWLEGQRPLAFDQYRQRLALALANQDSDQLMQRALLGTMEQIFADALMELKRLPFDTRDLPVDKGRCALTPAVQAPFQGFIQGLLDEVVQYNRTSCALSNFPDEHKPSKEYIGVTLKDIAAAFREYSLGANSLLLAKGETDAPASASA